VIPTFELMHPTQVRDPFHRPGWVKTRNLVLS
jgi:hypothetical protein